MLGPSWDYANTDSHRDNTLKKKILIAIDGSVYSDQSLSYTATLFSNQEDVRFHLITCLRSSSTQPEAIDSKNSLFPESLEQQRKIGAANIRIKKAIQKLTSHGVNHEHISSSVLTTSSDIGATIQYHAQKQLIDAIVVGRRGIGRVGEMFMGSVSTSLFQKCHSVPLWIVDGEIQSTEILVPLDRTVHSLLATDHLSHIFSDRKDINFHLFHCRKLFGNNKKNKDITDTKQLDPKWLDILQDEDNFLSKGPAQILVNSGIQKENIKILPEVIDLEESHSIIRQAAQLKCGTIVMGRRGADMAKGFLGGVSDRTFYRTQNMALWIVG